MIPERFQLISKRTVLASGLPGLWAAQYPALREGRRIHSAVRHVSETLRLLQLPYRLVFAGVLRALPLLLTGGGQRGLAAHGARLNRVPIVSQVLRVTTALAVYGALDSEEAGRGR